MNELRELNVAEMSAVEGGSNLLGELLSALQDFLTAEVLGPIIQSVTGFLSSVSSSIVSFLQGLFD